MMRKSGLGVLVGAALLVVGLARTSYAAEVLVLEASAGLPFHKGEVIDGARNVSVPAGGQLLLMDGSGKAVSLQGPYRGPAGGAAAGGAPGMLKRLSAMVTSKGGSGGTVIGAVRDVAVPPPARLRPRDPWLVDVTSNGDRCVANDGATLWRHDTDQSFTLAMRREPASDWVRAVWPAGRSTLPWPKDLAREDGARYRVMLNGPLSTKFITLHVAPPRFVSDGARLVWLYESGCNTQAQTLIDRLAEWAPRK